eukprot:TRINITY_DN13379_c0_g1_i1.p1 TRINITY_DN13379_c0_g1~~TRINITY_DN13379_c0_g1_i1.p1  ORF type:complete len:180 (+),score=4.14 TRINITY_DN13379_c0_g1_i1:69-542(+)
MAALAAMIAAAAGAAARPWTIPAEPASSSGGRTSPPPTSTGLTCIPRRRPARPALRAARALPYRSAFLYPFRTGAPSTHSAPAHHLPIPHRDGAHARLVPGTPAKLPPDAPAASDRRHDAASRTAAGTAPTTPTAVTTSVRAHHYVFTCPTHAPIAR